MTGIIGQFIFPQECAFEREFALIEAHPSKSKIHYNQQSQKNYFYHIFKSNGSYYLFDIVTSTALEVDEIAYHFMKDLKQISLEESVENLKNLYSQNEIDSILEEFTQLKLQGLFHKFKPQKLEFSLDQISSYNPHHFILIVTQKCNLRCKYCYEKNHKNNINQNHLELKTAHKAVDYLLTNSKSKKCGLTFFGGEPLINFDLIKKVIRYAKHKARAIGKEFYFSMTSNGTLLNDEIISFLSKEGFNLLLSFDGPKNINDNFRIFPNGQGSYQSIYNNIKKLQKMSDFHFTIRATLTHQCISLRQLSKYFSDEGISKAYIQPVSSHSTQENDDKFKLKKNDINLLLKEYKKVADLIINNQKEKRHIVFNPFKDYMELLHDNAVRQITCGVCRGMMAVGTDGLLYPCQRFVGMNNFVIGNTDQWVDAPKVLSIYQKFNEARKSCKSCWAFYLCAGGCMHDWAQNDGSLKKQSEERCRITKKLIELSILLYSKIA